MSKQYDICVIGGGAAGMAAALGAYENGAKKVLVIERDVELGGILEQCIHNGFGLHTFKEELTGPQYAERYKDKIDNSDIEVKLNTTVLSITKDKSVEYVNEEEGYQVINAKAVIIATGCRERSRHGIDIPGSRCAGIYSAGTAQRYLNMDGYLVGKKVFILGSGDIGLIMARRMTLEGAKVLGVAELMPYSNGLNRNIVQCLHDYDIPLYLSHTVTKIEGKDRLEKLTISQVDDKFNIIPDTDKVFEVDTLLLSVGLIPENNLLKDIGITINPITNGAFVDENYQTDIDGVFACGNSLHVHDLVDFVSGEGYAAGKNAASYVKKEYSTNNIEKINIIAGENVRYVVPNYFSFDKKEGITYMFRVSKPLSSGILKINVNNKVVKEIKKAHMLPAEMENITIKQELLENIDNIETIKISVESSDDNERN